jgi:hypothetical protein
MRLTRRGWIVVYGGAVLLGAVIGFATADYCWYGYCGL